MKQKVIAVGVIMFLCSWSPLLISAQEETESQVTPLEERVDSIEFSVKQLTIDVSTLSPALSVAQEESKNEFSRLEARIDSLETYIREFTASLNTFTKGVNDQIAAKVRVESDKVIALSPVSKKFTKIETNAGSFVLVINKFQRTEEGYRLLLNIGNPNAAKFSGLRFKLRWGRIWDPNSVTITYEDWRASLIGGEYIYPGELTPGEWTEITLDLPPPGQHQLDYIECEMEVDSVVLLKPDGTLAKPNPKKKKKKK